MDASCWRMVTRQSPLHPSDLGILAACAAARFDRQHSSSRSPASTRHGVGDITWRDLPWLLLSAFQTSAIVMVVIGATGCLAWLLTSNKSRFSSRSGFGSWRTNRGYRITSGLLNTCPNQAPFADVFVAPRHYGVVTPTRPITPLPQGPDAALAVARSLRGGAVLTRVE